MKKIHLMFEFIPVWIYTFAHSLQIVSQIQVYFPLVFPTKKINRREEMGKSA